MIPIGTKVWILGDRNPSSPAYDISKHKHHHLGHYLVDGTEAVVEFSDPRHRDCYLIEGECKRGGEISQTLHRGQFKIIKEEKS